MTVGLNEIREARERVRSALVETPCTRSDLFGERFGGRAWFKFENLQRTGSFKERGALNCLLLIPEAERSRGVVLASAGNHAQGVAYHASRLGIEATIVMPERTPLIKVSNTESYGARVVLHGSGYDEALEEARRIQATDGATMVHAFDEDAIIAGQGTLGLELIEQCPEMDVVVVPLGGGGLISGTAMAIKENRRDVRVIGVEANVMASALQARKAGHPVTVPFAETIADGIAVRRIGDRNYPLIERYVDEIVTVSEEDIASAVLLLLEQEKTVVEAAGATALAAVLGGGIAGLEGADVVMVLSGGNIDVNLLSRIIERGLVNDGRVTNLLVKIRDRPGALAGLTALLAELGANILELEHHRGTRGVWVTDVDVALRLEMRGPEHVRELVDALAAAGYQLQQN